MINTLERLLLMERIFPSFCKNIFVEEDETDNS